LLVSGGTNAEGEQKEIRVANLNGDCHMLLLSVIDLAYSQGEHEQHTSTEQRLQHVLRGSMDRVVHLGIYKGGALSEISTGTQGEYGQQNVSLGKRLSWFALCP